MGQKGESLDMHEKKQRPEGMALEIHDRNDLLVSDNAELRELDVNA